MALCKIHNGYTTENAQDEGLGGLERRTGEMREKRCPLIKMDIRFCSCWLHLNTRRRAALQQAGRTFSGEPLVRQLNTLSCRNIVQQLECVMCAQGHWGTSKRQSPVRVQAPCTGESQRAWHMRSARLARTRRYVPQYFW
jgi:hypothetical protein